MAKVITFSRRYPAYHPKIGVLTNFPEKFLKAWCLIHSKEEATTLPQLEKHYIDLSIYDNCNPKWHTIRAGKRFKEGDYFSPRIWSGQPYKSPQIILAPDTKIEKVWNIEIHSNYDIYINNKFYCTFFESEKFKQLAKNDGLNTDNFRDWFLKDPTYKRTLHFSGQIICWNKDINYE